MEVQPNGISQWAFEDTVITGRVTIEKPSAKLLRAVAAAEAAGDLRVKASQEERARMGKAVESDADSVKAQARAMTDGSWHVGSHEAFIAYAEASLAEDDAEKSLTLDERVRRARRQEDPVERGGMTDAQRAYLEHGINVSRAYLKARGKHDHENAVRVALGQTVVDDG